MEDRARIEEIKKLMQEKKYQELLEALREIKFEKVKNINDVLIGSDAYEAAGKLEEARDLLLLAHERSPIGRMILYKLCNISIKLKDLEVAQEYYNEFVQIAPHDSLKYILKYNINVAKNADNHTLIKILEQLKEHDFIEEWAYELAYLYHKTNQAEKCIELCDEIVLWFGDGPIVERALELKMLYQPLDKSQEDKYRHFQQKKDGITEISANELLNSGEIVSHTMTIPSIELPSGPERFNTINLQAEIKKNIDEIMKATEAGAVSENMDAIKNLVEEIPYLKVQEPIEESPEIEKFSVNDTFQEYLKEGYDGQLSLFLPEGDNDEEQQIEGQMTIEDVMAEWERTKRAAEAALEEAKAKELEAARSRALKEANQVLTRLEGAMSKLDAGMTSVDLLKEEYLSGGTDDNSNEAEMSLKGDNFETADTGFSIPRINAAGEVAGSVDIPVIRPVAPVVTTGINIDPTVSIGNAEKDWQPLDLENKGGDEEVDFKEASQMIADVNKLLQQEIDRLTVDEESETNNEINGNTEEIKISTEQEGNNLEPTISLVSSEPTISSVYSEEDEIGEIKGEEPNFQFTIELPSDVFSEEELAEMEEKQLQIAAETRPALEMQSDEIEGIAVEEIDIEDEPIGPIVFDDELPTIDEAVLEPEELAELVDEKVLENVIKDELPTLKLDDDDLATFSYFLPIEGMKNNIMQVLTGAATHLENPDSNGGNIVIIGEKGSGKTQLATSIIKVLQKKTDKLKGGVGKVSGEKLNKKDIQTLYSKIQGGCLIIEDAGTISKETAVTLSLLMEQDKTGTTLILEDGKKGIESALTKDSSFAKRFTEKIVIPIFSIDELVSFAKTYGLEAGFVIEEMGVLALYNRINLIGRFDHATTIKDVAMIMDEAMAKASKTGLFTKPKYDKNGNIVLKEKDFDN